MTSSNSSNICLPSPIEENQLKCSFCLNFLQNPKVLPCQHTFCKDCIWKELKNSKNESESESINCPNCFTRHNLRPDEVEHLKTNHFVQNLLLANEENCDNHQTIAQECSSCKSINFIAYCDECHDYLCNVCLDSHNVLRFTRNHKWKYFINSPNSNSGEVNLNEMCAAHKSMQITHYCTNCKVWLCHDCTTKTGFHDHHNLVESDIAYHSLRSSTLVSTTKISSRLEECKALLNESQISTTADVEQVYNKIANVLKLQLSKIKQSILTMCEIDNWEISSLIKRLENCKKERQKQCSGLYDILRFANDIDLILIETNKLAASISLKAKQMPLTFNNLIRTNDNNMNFEMKKAKIKSKSTDNEIKCDDNIKGKKLAYLFGEIFVRELEVNWHNRSLLTPASWKLHIQYQLHGANINSLCLHNKGGLAILDEKLQHVVILNPSFMSGYSFKVDENETSIKIQSALENSDNSYFYLKNCGNTKSVTSTNIKSLETNKIIKNVYDFNGLVIVAADCDDEVHFTIYSLNKDKEYKKVDTHTASLLKIIPESVFLPFKCELLSNIPPSDFGSQTIAAAKKPISSSLNVAKSVKVPSHKTALTGIEVCLDCNYLTRRAILKFLCRTLDSNTTEALVVKEYALPDRNFQFDKLETLVKSPAKFRTSSINLLVAGNADSSEFVIFVDIVNEIVKISCSGILLSSFPVKPTMDKRIQPFGLCIDSANNVILADTASNEIHFYNSFGEHERFISLDQFTHAFVKPSVMAYDRENDLFVFATQSGMISAAKLIMN